MSNTNCVVISGRLGGDPETKQISDKFSVTEFSIAVNRWDGSKKEQVTDWYPIVFFNLSEKINLTKGDYICITGKLVQEKWTKEGKNMSKIVIHGNGFEFIPKQEKPKEQTDRF